MQRSRLTRREALRLAGLSGLGMALLSACGQQPAPAKPAETKPAESKPAEAAKPVESKPAAPAAAAPTQAAPAAAKPAESKPAAAGKPEAANPSMAAAGEMPKRGGTLRAVVQNDFVTMWPLITTGPTASVCFDTLVQWRKGDDGRWGPKPGLAESWDLQEKAAIFKLRKGVKFHDGSDFNADALKYNVDLWMKHPKSIAKSNLRTVNTENPSEIVDDYTLKINLNSPAGSILSALSDGARETGIFSKVAHQKLGDDGMNLQAVGSGPFIFDQFQSGSQLVVKKNPNYWEKGLDGQPLPYLDGIHYRFVPDDSVRFTELRAGSADIAQLLRGRDVPAMKSDPNLNYYEDPQQGRLYRFFFNAQKPPFKDNLKLRQAVQHAIDRDAMAKAIGGGIGAANYYDLTEGTLGYDPSVPKYVFDLDKAKALIKESGVTTPLTVRLTVITREADLQQAQILQQMLDKIGIKIDIEGLERVAWGQKVRQSNDFEMATQQTSTPLDPDTISQAWAPDGPAAYVRPNEPQIQDCLQEGRSAYDLSKRQATYVKCTTQMYETAWWGHMWIQPYNYLTNKKLRISSPFYSEDWREWSMWFNA